MIALTPGPAIAGPDSGQDGTQLSVRGCMTARGSDLADAGSSSCPWSWCRAETATTVGTARLVAHAGAGTAVSVPPDELIVYLVAVGDDHPTVVIEPTSDDWTALVLDLGQATRLGDAVRAVVAATVDVSAT